MDKEEIYEAIVAWEHDRGESFLDQGFDLNPLTFMTWCLGKGLLSPDRYNHWVVDWNRNKLEAIDANYFVYNSYDYHGEVPFAVVSSEEWNDEDQEKAYRILAEFISQIDVYQKRFAEYIEE